jgi:hypothetical protein
MKTGHGFRDLGLSVLWEFVALSGRRSDLTPWKENNAWMRQLRSHPPRSTRPRIGFKLGSWVVVAVYGKRNTWTSRPSTSDCSDAWRTWEKAAKSGATRQNSYVDESKNWNSRPRPCKSRPRLLKNTDLPEVLDLDDEPSPGSHGYSVGVQCLFLRLVLTGVALRAVPRVLEIISAALGLALPIPDWTTGRLWLLRLGHAMLTTTLQKAPDWAWLVDHSVQIGREKCLVILGIRLQDLPEQGTCLRHCDLELVALVLRESWTRREVDDALEAAIQRTGVPRVIVDDHGVDIAGGVNFFQQRHPETVEIYDVKHKAACLLTSLLDKNPRWHEFQQGIARTRCGVQQTELAFLGPPAQKPKARYMNLAPTLNWAEHVLGVLRRPPDVVTQRVSWERLHEKLGWIREFECEIAEWAEWQEVVNAAVEFVGRQGIYRDAAKALRTELRPHLGFPSTRSLAKELLVFVAQQARRARPGERFPGSTEALESCFGRFKQLEKQQSRGGFTSLVLGFGALLAETTTTAIAHAMRQSPTKAVFEWCAEHLGTTLFSRRRQAFAVGATETQ